MRPSISSTSLGEGARELSVLVESNQKEFVLWIGGLEKLNRSLFGFTDFVRHAAAQIEDDSDGNRNVLGREGDNLLLDVVFEDPEIVWLETCDEAVIRIGDGDVNKCQLHVQMDRLALLNGLSGCVVLDVVRDRRSCGRMCRQSPDNDRK